MRPLPFIPINITLTPAPQAYAVIFIPKNLITTYKFIRTKFVADVHTAAPNQPGGPTYSESLHIPGVGTAARLAPNLIATVPSGYKILAERDFYYDGSVIVEFNVFPVGVPNSLSYSDYMDHKIVVPNTIAPFDPTVDNYLEFQMATSWVGSTDQILIQSGQAWIQAPLSINRLPR
jgi:hypothetical protein